MEFSPFTPSFGSNQAVTLGVAAEQHFRIIVADRTLRIMNTGGTNPLYFKTYASGSTVLAPPAPATLASVADCRVNASMTTTIGMPATHDAISLFSPAGTTVEFMTGNGGV
jgi:hypothetical protein